MRIPDWLVYSFVLVVIVAALFAYGNYLDEASPTPAGVAATAPMIPERPAARRPLLRDPDPFDEHVLVQVGQAENGIGTAFAINKSGLWLTARHVVDGCTRVGLAVGDGRMVQVEEVRTSKNSDLALLVTDRAPAVIALDLDRQLRIGEAGYHIGFPQGKSGEASSELLERSSLITRGRYAMEEPVLAWGETGRSSGIDGTLSGMSGGPVFDEDGAVVGITVAESPRRGRIYTASPDSIARFLDDQGVIAPGGDVHPLGAASYADEADRLRRDLAVVKVLCRVTPS